MTKLSAIQKTILTIGVVLIVIMIIVIGYNSKWTGLGEYVDASGQIHPAKTLWDWLDLFIIPVFLALGGLAINTTFQTVERKRTEQQALIDREIAADQMQEEALQHYLDRMSDLLLYRGLGDENIDETTKTVARSRTLTTLRGLDPKRKGVLLRFLYSAGLINSDPPIIDLQTANLKDASLHNVQFRDVILRDIRLNDADLEDANLRGAHFERADLAGANLRNAELKGTYFQGANLEGADFTGATIDGAYFAGANLTDAKMPLELIKDAYSLKGTTMPDGTKRD